METDQKEVVLFVDAATPVQVIAWRTKQGGLYLDERTARYVGCTHRPCEGCGELTPKGFTYCKACSDACTRKRYAALPKKPWDEGTPVCEFDGDNYYFSRDEVEEHLEWISDELGSPTVADLMLVHCKPSKPREFDVLDFLCDWLPEDWDRNDLPQELLDAEEALNAELRKCASLVWEPSGEAVLWEE